MRRMGHALVTTVAVVALAVAGMAMGPRQAHAATYSGACGTVTWSLDTDTGELHLEPTDGESGTLAKATISKYNRYTHRYDTSQAWPWVDEYASYVRSVTSSGSIVCDADMSQLFAACTNLSDISALASWDTSNVTDMSSMFFDTSIEDVAALGSWDTSGVTDMSGMFQFCLSLKDATAIGSWDTSNVTSIGGMFEWCTKLTTVDMHNWDTSAVKTNGGAFSNDDIVTAYIGTDVTKDVISALCYGGLSSGESFVRADGAYGPYTASELAENWTPAMAGLWIVAPKPVTYTVALDAIGGTGSMAGLTFHTDGTPDVLPASAYMWVDHNFTGWNTKADGTGTSYQPSVLTTPLVDGTTGQAAVAGATVTLYAQWEAMPGTVTSSDGEFDVTLHAGEQVTIEGLPAGSTYIVTETPVPDGWQLVRQQDTTGIITPEG